jgi:cytochrome c oxidase subunit 1
MPRRVVTYPQHLQALNDWVSVSAFILGGFMLVFLVNLIWTQIIDPVPAEPNPWASRALEWQLPTPVPADNFDEVPTILAWPYDYGVVDAPPVAALHREPVPVA